MTEITAQERQRIASVLDLNEQYLYQMLSGRREAPPKHCADIERVSGCVVMRWDLRPTDWHRIWPELVGRKGAPQPTTEASS